MITKLKVRMPRSLSRIVYDDDDDDDDDDISVRPIGDHRSDHQVSQGDARAEEAAQHNTRTQGQYPRVLKVSSVAASVVFLYPMEQSIDSFII